MIIGLKKVAGALVPSLPEDEEKMSRWSYGSILKCEVTKPRNGGFHRKFFALVSVVYNNQSKYENIEDLLVELKLKAGHYREHITTKGKLVYVPKSISFAKMDDMAFASFYSKVIDIVLKDFMPVEPAELDRMVDKVLSFS